MTKNSRITIITVVRNDVSHIEGTMQSVLNQSYPEIEYIVIDGGSTDGTVDVIKRYADRLVYWVSEPDGGIYPAMNKALDVLSGMYKDSDNEVWVNFMNSGDTFADAMVLEDIFGDAGYLHQIEETTYNNLKVIGGHTYQIYPNRREKLFAKGGASAREMLPFCHQSSFVRFGKGFDWRFNLRYQIAADYNLFYSIWQKYGAASIMTVDRFVSCYQMDGSMTFENLRNAKGEYLRIQSNRPTWRWLKEYIKWKCFWKE